jgi:hypothetical protein
MKKTILILIITSLVLVSALVFYHKEKMAMSSINNFDSCLKNGYPVMESYPRKCSTPDGRDFLEEIGFVETPVVEEKIIVISPKSGDEVMSPIKISGKARGGWFFEASFPAELIDSNGKQIAIIPVTAKTDWMTSDFVEFYAELDFGNVDTETGTLILRKDNPSGMPEYDDSISIPVKF